MHGFRETTKVAPGPRVAIALGHRASRRVHRTRRLAVLLSASMILGGCAATEGQLPSPPTPSPVPSPSPSPRPTPSPSQQESTGDECQSAPPWLVTAIEGSLTPPGATLSRIFAARAAELDQGSSPNEAWLVGALINGAGVRPEIGIWLIDRLDARATPSLLAMSVSAQRYSSLPIGDRSLLSGANAVRLLTACIGPIPES